MVRLALLQARWGNPLLANQFLLRSGAWPVSASEVMVSSAFAKSAHLKIGTHFDLTLPKLAVTVVGIYEQRDYLGDLSIAFPATDALPSPGVNTQSFVDLGSHVTDDQINAFFAENRSHWSPNYPPVEFTGPASSMTVVHRTQYISNGLVGMQIGFVIALFLLGIISAAAFAVGAKRQLRQLGLVAANGGDPRQVGRMITLQGTVAAGLGTTLGLFLGFAAVAVVAPFANHIRGYVIPGLVIQPFDWLIAAVFAVLAGTAAAGLAARQARRVPVLSALGGRRPLGQLDSRFPVAGTLCSTLGLVVLFAATGVNLTRHWVVAAAGAIAVILGGLITAPYLVSRLEPAANRFGGALRIAARRTARHRARTGPLVGAIMATCAVAIGVAALARSADAGNQANYTPGMPSNQVIVDRQRRDATNAVVTHPESYTSALVDRITAIVPGARAATYVPLRGGQLESEAFYSLSIVALGDTQIVVYVGSEELLRNLGVSEAVIDQFRTGKALLAGGAAAGDTIVKKTISKPSNDGNLSNEHTELTHIPTVGWSALSIGYDGQVSCARPGVCSSRIPMLILPPSQAERLGFSEQTPSLLLSAPRPLTSSQRTDLQRLQDDLLIEADEAAVAAGSIYATASYLYFETNSSSHTNLLELIASGAALVLALLVTGIALALATTDNRSDDTTLVALGAGPGFRRRVRGWEGALLAGMGVLLAIPIGFLPAVAFRQARQNGDPIVFPWLTVGLLLVVVPLAAWAVGWLSGRTPRRITQTALQFD